MSEPRFIGCGVDIGIEDYLKAIILLNFLNCKPQTVNSTIFARLK